MRTQALVVVKSTLRLSASALLLLSDLARAAHEIFIGGQFFEAHRTAGVESIGADTDLRPKTKFVAVIKTGRGIPEDDGTINAAEKFFCGSVVRCHNGVRMVGTMCLNVRDRRRAIIDNFDRENEIKKFGAKIFRCGGLNRAIIFSENR